MSKSTVILVALLWVLCTLYYTLAKINDLPYAVAARTGSWVASGLLLICIIIYIRKHKGK